MAVITREQQQKEQYYDELFFDFEAIASALFRRLAPSVTPLVPAFFFGHAIYSAIGDQGTHWAIALVIGFSAGVGLESAGFRAFHLALEHHDGVRFVPPIMYLIIGIGSILLVEGFTPIGIIGTAMFLMTAIVYLCVGMSRQLDEDEARRQEAKQAVIDSKWQAFEIEQAKLDREADRKRADKDAAAERRVLTKTVATSTRQEAATYSGNLPSDWRQLTDAQKRQLARATREERENMMPDIADRTRRVWHERLDKIPTS